MIHRLFAVSLSGGAALFLIALHLSAGGSGGGPPVARAAAQHEQSDEGDFTEKEEVRRSYQLAPGARVEVSGIHGAVKIETAATDTAEIYIVRSARRREDLNFRRINVEQTGGSLIVRGVRASEEPNVRVRHRVVLRLPRRVELLTESINGGVRIGEIDGPVRLRSINGGAEVARATGYTEISSVNGGVTMTIARLGERGINVTHVNGGVNFRFTEDLDADVKVTDFNGGVIAEMPGVRVLTSEKHSVFRARIGSGGTLITIAHVKGGVRLSRSA